MIRYANERAIRRNAMLGKILTFGGLGVLVLGLILSVAYPAQVNGVLGIAWWACWPRSLGWSSTIAGRAARAWTRCWMTPSRGWTGAMPSSTTR